MNFIVIRSSYPLNLRNHRNGKQTTSCRLLVIMRMLRFEMFSCSFEQKLSFLPSKHPLVQSDNKGIVSSIGLHRRIPSTLRCFLADLLMLSPSADRFYHWSNRRGARWKWKMVRSITNGISSSKMVRRPLSKLSFLHRPGPGWLSGLFVGQSTIPRPYFTVSGNLTALRWLAVQIIERLSSACGLLWLWYNDRTPISRTVLQFLLDLCHDWKFEAWESSNPWTRSRVTVLRRKFDCAVVICRFTLWIYRYGIL